MVFGTCISSKNTGAAAQSKQFAALQVAVDFVRGAKLYSSKSLRGSSDVHWPYC